MTGSVTVGLVEVYEGLRLFTTKDRLAQRTRVKRAVPQYTHDTEQAVDGDVRVTKTERLGQMQLQ